jgi:CheY-like chemotaxis protein
MVELKTILLVEDNPQDVELILNALSEYRLANNVAAVSDGVEALEYLRCKGKFKGRTTGDPVVVMLDIKMPRMDGIEVLEAIRKDEKLKHIPAVMLTSSREDPDLKKCYALGVNASVVKPVDFNEFIKAVKHIGVFWAVLNEPPPKPQPRSRQAVPRQHMGLRRTRSGR